jgi:hypothetical protein
MATYHLTVKNHSRSKNANGVALASYRSGERLWDETQQSFKDCRNHSKSEVLYTELMNNGNMTREQLWNTAEKNENRKNSVVAREIEIALPYEVSNEMRLELSRELSGYLVKRYNCAVDLAVHAPDKGGDDRNYHAHILMTTREVSPGGLGAKWRQLNQPNGAGRIELTEIRETFSKMQNRILEKAAVKDRVSAKSSRELDQPKKYQELSFNKYQVLRREGRLEDYKEVSGVEELERFKKWKDIEIEDLMGEIVLMEAEEAMDMFSYYDPVSALIEEDIERHEEERKLQEQERIEDERRRIGQLGEMARVNQPENGQAGREARDLRGDYQSCRERTTEACRDVEQGVGRVRRGKHQYGIVAGAIITLAEKIRRAYRTRSRVRAESGKLERFKGWAKKLWVKANTVPDTGRPSWENASRIAHIQAFEQIEARVKAWKDYPYIKGGQLYGAESTLENFTMHRDIISIDLGNLEKDVRKINKKDLLLAKIDEMATSIEARSKNIVPGLKQILIEEQERKRIEVEEAKRKRDIRIEKAQKIEITPLRDYLKKDNDTKGRGGGIRM